MVLVFSTSRNSEPVFCYSRWLMMSVCFCFFFLGVFHDHESGASMIFVKKQNKTKKRTIQVRWWGQRAHFKCLTVRRTTAPKWNKKKMGDPDFFLVNFSTNRSPPSWHVFSYEIRPGENKCNCRTLISKRLWLQKRKFNNWRQCGSEEQHKRYDIFFGRRSNSPLC